MKDDNSILHTVVNDEISKILLSYIGTFPTNRPITTIVCHYPKHLPTLSCYASRGEYREYFEKRISPVSVHFANRQNSFWYMASYPVSKDVVGGLDKCCQEIFDLQSIPMGVTKPKEQLHVSDSVILISKFRKCTTPIDDGHSSGGLIFDEATMRAFESLSQLVATTTTDGRIFGNCGFENSNRLSSFVSGNLTNSSSSSFDGGLIEAIGGGCGGCGGGDDDDEVPLVTPARISEEEIREAAINVLNSYSNRTIGGPMAITLRGLAEGILGKTDSGPLLSSLFPI